jgi:glycosyltransferase involved in cell wall biosynthesis
MTIAECGALGVPAIVLDSGGITEMLLPSQSGLIARNDEEFRSHLMLAGSRLANQETLGGQAKLFARTKFSPSAIAQAYTNLY